MSQDFEDMKVLKVLVTQVSNETPHKIHHMGKAREFYFQVVVFIARIHTYIFLPLTQIACMKILGDDLSATNAILSTIAILFILQVDNILLKAIVRNDEDDLAVVTHESMARRIYVHKMVFFFGGFFLSLTANYIVIAMRMNCMGPNADVFILSLGLIILVINYLYEVITR